MLQQTPVAPGAARLRAWLERWPTPAALAAAAPGEAVRMWGKLGYPRRALRLHECARSHHRTLRRRGADASRPTLLALPGVGDYTARAVAVFALRAAPAGRRHERAARRGPRRRRARATPGRRRPAATWPRSRRCCPTTTALAARVSIALMELGALVCTARAPRCGRVPCSSRTAPGAPPGRPPYDRPESAAAAVRRHRPPGTRTAHGRAAWRGRAGQPRSHSTGSGTTPCSASGRWPRWSTRRALDGRLALPDGSTYRR